MVFAPSWSLALESEVGDPVNATAMSRRLANLQYASVDEYGRLMSIHVVMVLIRRCKGKTGIHDVTAWLTRSNPP